MAFQPGDIIRVKSGGPELTVLSSEDDKVVGLFFSEELGEFKETTLPSIALETADLSDDDGPEDEEDEEDDAEEDGESEQQGAAPKKKRLAA